MFSGMILIFYLIIIAMYVLASFFIVYHLASYSINSELRIVMLSLFVLVSAGLLFSNLLLFFTLDWNEIFLSAINY